MISFFKKIFFGYNVSSLIAYIPIWILIAVLSAILLNVNGISLLNSFIISLFFSVPFSIISYSARYVCRVMPVKDINLLHFPAHGGTAIVISAVMSGLTIMISRLLPEIEQLITYNSIGILFIAGVTGHVVSIIYHYLVIAVKDNLEAERMMDEERLLKRDAELKAIRAQLDPHFLFNSLNSISALISADGKKAQEMVLLLSDFFRRTISSKAHDTITLKEEIDFVKGYLQIEQIRFGDRMDVEIIVDERSESAMVPVFLLQPLLENAVKHGVSHSIEKVKISINVLLKNELVRIIVKNDFDLSELKKSVATGNSKGLNLGIMSVEKRLEYFFKDESDFHISRDNSVFTVRMTFPFIKSLKFEGEEVNSAAD